MVKCIFSFLVESADCKSQRGAVDSLGNYQYDFIEFESCLSHSASANYVF